MSKIDNFFNSVSVYNSGVFTSSLRVILFILIQTHQHLKLLTPVAFFSALPN